MRPDHTAVDFSTPHSAMPLPTPTLIDGDGLEESQPRPLTRITFCFAWLFGLEPFLLGGTNEAPSSGMKRRA